MSADSLAPIAACVHAPDPAVDLARHAAIRFNLDVILRFAASVADFPLPDDANRHPCSGHELVRPPRRHRQLTSSVPRWRYNGRGGPRASGGLWSRRCPRLGTGLDGLPFAAWGGYFEPMEHNAMSTLAMYATMRLR
jgi:hypothetical protein